MLYLQIVLNPAGAPAYDVPPTTWVHKIKFVTFNILPVSLVIFMVIGFIILGIATPTESAACGVLGVFIHEALVERASQGRRVPVPAVVAVVSAAAIGVVDEGIQWFLPNRVFDPVDMLFNFLAATTSVAAVVALAWARRWTLRRLRRPGASGGRRRGGGGRR